jgi:hypothetical protein
VFLDATRPFPSADMTFEYVFPENQIERNTEADATATVRDCFRVLRAAAGYDWRRRIWHASSVSITIRWTSSSAATCVHWVLTTLRRRTSA